MPGSFVAMERKSIIGFSMNISYGKSVETYRIQIPLETNNYPCSLQGCLYTVLALIIGMVKNNINTVVRR